MTRLEQALQASETRPILGAALYFYDPIFLEIAARLGFRVIWIEMEHAHITFAEAADLCRMAAGSGMLTMIRIPDTRRENVLKAAECGPDIIDVPMIESPEQLKELVAYARFFPQGARGIFSGTRAVNYGLGAGLLQAQKQLNDDICLMGQIETEKAVERLDDLCAVPGADLFIGPADLAASFGLPGQTAHPKVLDAGRRVIEAARKTGKKVATSCGPDDFIHWVRLGVDLLFCTNDIASLKVGAAAALGKAHESIARVQEERSVVAEKGSH